MNPFAIDKKNVNAEVLAKITNSLVKPYGCSVKYDKKSGKINLAGDKSCREIVVEVVEDLFKTE